MRRPSTKLMPEMSATTSARARAWRAGAAHHRHGQVGGPQAGGHERERQVDPEQLDRPLRRDGHLGTGSGQRRPVIARGWTPR